MRLTQPLQDQIVAAIRAGSYPQVAAAALGVTKRTFEQWLKRGRMEDAEDRYREFTAAVEEATAQARLRAEMEVFKDQPRIWLEHGPGRETPNQPGWTSNAKPSAKAVLETNPFLDPHLMQILRALVESLKDFPDARAHGAAIIAAFEPKAITQDIEEPALTSEPRP